MAIPTRPRFKGIRFDCNVAAMTTIVLSVCGAGLGLGTDETLCGPIIGGAALSDAPTELPPRGSVGIAPALGDGILAVANFLDSAADARQRPGSAP